MKDCFERPLFVFEMANNHMGSVEHGLAMIKAFADLSRRFRFQFAFKFQFRSLDTFIHPEYKSRSDMKYVKRFTETGLTKEEFRRLKDAVEEAGFISMCTPFDEQSVDLIEEMDFDVIKIASCSFTDWPLLERIALADKPLVASTSGASLGDIDNVAGFFQHRSKRFALMHCVGEYPTRIDHAQMNQIDLLKRRYPGVPVGYSTHEDPEDTESVQIAIAKGAVIFEKHVAVETEAFRKNEYSATPEQALKWLESADRAYKMCGLPGGRSKPGEKELADLKQFKRGVFAARKISKGERIQPVDMFFAFPNADGQFVANDVSKYTEFVAERDIEAMSPLVMDNVACVDKRERVNSIVQRVKGLLKAGNIVVPGIATLEISHHYGLDRFEEVGCTIINVINREYCKKLIVVLPGQKHPEQFHKVKEETFLVPYGDVQLTLDGVVKTYKGGDLVTVTRGTKHAFTSVGGAVIEEISSTHLKDDSYYTEGSILKNGDRKTQIAYWMNLE
jgi:sialic acid synthase SpsE/quercetin dioxygenase-like cupin family protein